MELRAYEDARHASADFSSQPSSNRVLGPEPYVVLPVPDDDGVRGGPRYVGLLRGAERVVLLDASLREKSRAEGPALASALVVTHTGDILSAGEGSALVSRHRIVDGRLEPRGTLDLAAGDRRRTIRALGSHPSGTLYALDEAGDALVVAPASGDPPFAVRVPSGPIRIVVTPHSVVVASLLAHALAVFHVDDGGLPRGEPTVVRHDGPFWSVAAEERAGVLYVAAGGVEDHALDRTGGSFAYIDSYVYLYRINEAEATRLAAIDVGDEGVVTPKALAFTKGGLGLRVVGYGAPRGVDLIWPGSADVPDFTAAPKVSTFRVPPGISSMVAVDDDTSVYADPLLDAWIRSSREGLHVEAAGGELRGLPRTEASRLGEALFFTSLMSPWAKSEGPLSRFTCETCHFEGGVDGRTHHTGRGDVVATTKPLTGLFNNAPHFTRALDKNMTGMVHAEFRVASQNTGHSPWFSLDDALAEGALGPEPKDDRGRGFVDVLVGGRDKVDGSPKGLRRGLMEFLMDFSPRPNPAVLGRDRFDLVESEGARVFEERCSSCHAPRLVANDASTVVPFEDWEPFVFGSSAELTAGTIVWARDGYEKTGVEPYVHADGARPSSLRRIARVRPYFTNGSAASLDDVLSRARIDGGRFWHDASGAPPGAELEALGPDEQIALRAFLDLL